jgi:hypothetical protein
MRHALLALLLACSSLVHAQSTPAAAPNPLAPLESWVGGRWVMTVQRPDGAKISLIRVYEWAFDGRVLRGRSLAEADGKVRQSRETLYYWNAEAQKIEFLDFIEDGGGFGRGTIEARDGALYMDARIVGNPKHPHWRAWLTQDADGARQTIRVVAEQKGEWKEFGTFEYRRER